MKSKRKEFTKLSLLVLTHPDEDHFIGFKEVSGMNSADFAVTDKGISFEAKFMEYSTCPRVYTLEKRARPEPEPWSFRFLTGFGWFCSKDSKLIIATSIADTRRDLNDMRSAKCSKWWTRAMLTWQAGGVVVSIMWDEAIRVLKRAVEAKELLKKLGG